MVNIQESVTSVSITFKLVLSKLWLGSGLNPVAGASHTCPWTPMTHSHSDYTPTVLN